MNGHLVHSYMEGRACRCWHPYILCAGPSVDVGTYSGDCMRANSYTHRYTCKGWVEEVSCVLHLPGPEIRVHTQWLCTSAVWYTPTANNNATSCKWDGYPYTCRRGFAALKMAPRRDASSPFGWSLWLGFGRSRFGLERFGDYFLFVLECSARFYFPLRLECLFCIEIKGNPFKSLSRFQTPFSLIRNTGND